MVLIAVQSLSQTAAEWSVLEVCPLQINAIPTPRVKSDQVSHMLGPTPAFVILVNCDQALFWFTRYFTYTLIASLHMIPHDDSSMMWA